MPLASRRRCKPFRNPTTCSETYLSRYDSMVSPFIILTTKEGISLAFGACRSRELELRIYKQGRQLHGVLWRSKRSGLTTQTKTIDENNDTNGADWHISVSGPRIVRFHVLNPCYQGHCALLISARVSHTHRPLLAQNSSNEPRRPSNEVNSIFPFLISKKQLTI